jgi:Spy/CpxP family protein refolding chaperone
MNKEKEKAKSDSRNWVTMCVALLLILGGAAYTTMTWWSYSSGIPQQREGDEGEFRPERGGPRRDGPPSPQERQERFNQMARELNLSEDQKNQITQIWSAAPPEGREGWRERMEKMQSVLTPQQQEQAAASRESRRQQWKNRRLQEAKKSLPPDQFKIYQQRLNERASGRGGGRGGPRPGRGNGG